MTVKRNRSQRNKGTNKNSKNRFTIRSIEKKLVMGSYMEEILSALIGKIRTRPRLYAEQ